MKPLPVLTLAELNEIASYVVRTEKTATLALLQGQPTETTLLTIADRGHAVADEAVRFAHSRSPAAERPVCVRGCDACCYLHVVATVAEVVRIAAYVRDKLSMNEQIVIRHRIDREIEQTRGQTAEQRRTMRLPCPLLDTENRECKVHEVRPVACRGWNSLDLEICNFDRKNPQRNTPARVNVTQCVLVNKVTEGYREALAGLGKNSQSLDMARGLKAAMDNPKAGEDWITGAEVFSAAINDEVFLNGIEED